MKSFGEWLLNEDITNTYDNEINMYHLILSNNGEQISKLTYSLKPNIVFTQNKDKNKYVYIEQMDTPFKHRNKGYASQLVQKLKDLYKDKIIIASANDKSAGLLKKANVELI